MSDKKLFDISVQQYNGQGNWNLIIDETRQYIYSRTDDGFNAFWDPRDLTFKDPYELGQPWEDLVDNLVDYANIITNGDWLYYYDHENSTLYKLVGTQDDKWLFEVTDISDMPATFPDDYDDSVSMADSGNYRTEQDGDLVSYSIDLNTRYKFIISYKTIKEHEFLDKQGLATVIDQIKNSSGGAANEFVGTQAEWDALTAEEQNAYAKAYIKKEGDDTSNEYIGSEEAWDALTAEEQNAYAKAYFV